MKEWLDRLEKSLLRALEIAEQGAVPRKNLFMLAPIVYSEHMKTNNQSLLVEMLEEIEKQFEQDCLVDPNSGAQYRFHFVASYLHCFIVAGKIDEMKYDRIMDYVNENMDLFEEGYSFE